MVRRVHVVTPTPRPGRRRSTASKGDLRERAILDVVRRQLARDGAESVTVDSVAREVGITRAAFYFYFGSRSDALAAVLDETLTALRTEVAAMPLDPDSDPAHVLARAVRRTHAAWRDHGAVMRLGVELAPTVPAIDASWTATIDATTASLTPLTVRAGVPEGRGPTDAPAVTRALVWMTERVFYEAHRTGHPSLTQAARTCEATWARLLGLGST